MVNKKNIVLTALLLSLTAGSVFAGSNDLLKMDVKKSSALDTVDVTFYTTGGATNSVVTRKSDNRYVVLLPNVAGSSSVTPNIGGVKDLITNIDVKNVDDGIGGYTKVTFTTSKPVKIQTAMKKTAPLTKAQEDYKNLIAQNQNTKPAVQTKPAATAVPTVKPQAKTEAKPVVSNNTKTTNVTKSNSASVKQVKETPKVETKSTVKPAVVNKPIQSQPVPKVVQDTTKTVQNSENTYKPQMKFDANGKRVMNLEPQVDHRNVNTNNAPEKDKIQAESPKDTALSQNVENKQPELNTTEQGKNHNKIPTWMIGLGSILGLLAVGRIFKSGVKNTKVSYQQSYDNNLQTTKEEFKDIVNDESLNWQEKYSRYTEANEKLSNNENSDLSYVTDTSATKKSITPVIKKEKHAYKVNKIESNKDVLVHKENNVLPINSVDKKLSFRKLVKSMNNSSSRKEEIIKEQLRARISQMEHSLAQTPNLELPSEFAKKEIYSEDESILKGISNVRLKSFAQPKSLNSTHRMLLGAQRVPINAKEVKEGRFVKLKNSPLNISTRKSASSKINASDYYNNYGEMNMKKDNNYSQASLNEYLSILDNEEKTSKSFTISPVKTETVAGTTTNPIKSSHHPSFSTLNGMVVRSGYSIDSQKGFYLVDMDGVSALVGKVNDNIFILKKFDNIVNKNLQVRLDSGSTYMVKADKYKCLVDVTQDKMGTLIEI